VRSGSHSELEIWGVRHVLEAAGMPRFTRQYAVALRSTEDRERDTRRDIALAARGWVVLRFSYRRLTTDPEGCRREILQVIAARRALFAQR
jgi:hypothetical protein